MMSQSPTRRRLRAVATVPGAEYNAATGWDLSLSGPSAAAAAFPTERWPDFWPLSGPALPVAEADELSDVDDRALVDRAKAGDLDAFGQLHRRYYARLYRFAYLKTGNDEEAQDIASETFARALRHLPDFQFKRTESIYPWLHRIAGNLVVDQARRQPSQGMVSLDAQTAEEVGSFLDLLADKSPSPHELAEKQEVQALIRQAIAQLPQDQQDAVLYRFVADLPIRDMARLLERSEGAVKSLLHRALTTLRQRIREAYSDNGTVTAAQVEENGDGRQVVKVR